MQKDRKKQVIIYIVFCIVLALILAVYAFVLYVKQNYGSFGLFWETADFRLSNSKFYDNLDSARQEFKNSVKEADLNINAGQDYIENIEISQPDEDDRDGTSWFNVDKIVISVSMKEDIHKVYIQDRCQLFIDIKSEISGMMDDLYYSSEYYSLFNENRYEKNGVVADYIYYRNHKLSFNYYQKFSFYDGTYEYELRSSELVVKTGDDHRKIYSFELVDGEITNFTDLFKEGLIDEYGYYKKSDSESGGSDSKNSSSTQKESSSSGRGSTYDPYDVHDYDSAQDFADDKYEEFYDYEDNYEDEDEAYDAAEEYWYDEN